MGVSGDLAYVVKVGLVQRHGSSRALGFAKVPVEINISYCG